MEESQDQIFEMVKSLGLPSVMKSIIMKFVTKIYNIRGYNNMK